MNKLTTQKRAQVISCLIEGCSMRSTVRMTGVCKRTVARLVVEAGEACAKYHDGIMRNLNCKVLQVDEVWSFTYCKQANIPKGMEGKKGIGDTWTWVAIDANSKLIPAYRVGSRGAEDAYFFIHDLKARLADRVQLTSDGHKAYLQAVESAFGADIDFAQLVKLYGNEPAQGEVRYSPAACTGARKTPITGRPVDAQISTSFAERSNLSIRMGNRRFTRLTNAFSKKIENHKHALALYFMHYNFCRIHTTLRVTPAMEAGIADHVWSIEELAKLLP
ncbi:MAG: IS1 family transposase ISNisp5 [Verrucomicrobiae bacterium]|nr:IS1 family transposase ISNisp5 [Verrucomicrobiae bacterium]